MTQNSDPAAQAWLELPDGKLHWLGRECRIGRSKEGNDLPVDERLVSSRHLIINCDAGRYSLVDQHSTNGTYLNGMLVQKPTELKDGDEIGLAKMVTLRFRCAREQKLEGPQSFEKTTVHVNQHDARECWLLLADVAGYSPLIAKLGSEAALQKLQTWIAEMRPLIESNGGSINSYVGDAIFAYWPCELRPAEQVMAALRALESYRRRAPVNFRTVLHHGIVLFTKSSLGEELSGQEVNFIFRSEKIAKKFDCLGMLSQTAVKSLHLEGSCDVAGTSAVDGIAGMFTFHRMPRDLAGPIRILLIEEANGAGDALVQWFASRKNLTVCERSPHGAAARRLHAKLKPDVVVIDLAQRTGEALALIGDLQQADAQTRVVIVAADLDQAYLERAQQAGALGYVLKSEGKEQVVDTIRIVSEGGKYFSR